MAQMYRFTDANGEVRLMAEIDPAPGGAQPAVLSKTVPLSSAQLLAGAPVEVVPAAASVILLPLAVLFQLIHGTVTYDPGNTLAVGWAIFPDVISDGGNTLAGGFDKSYYKVAANDSEATSDITAAALIVTPTATSGNGSAVVTVYYMALNTA